MDTERHTGSTTTVCLTSKQRRTLFSRARKQGTTLSEEVRKALDLYLDFPLDFDRESLTALAEEANASLSRSIARLHRAIAHSMKAAATLEELDRC
jgi:hypothetical protein